MMRRLPIRLKVTVAFTGAMAILLAGIGIIVYQLFQRQLDETLNQGLRSRAGDVSALIQQREPQLDAPSRSVLVERGESFAQILDPSGRILDASPGLRAEPLLSPALLGRATRARSIIVEQPNPFEIGEPARLLATPVRVAGRTVVVVVGAGADDRNSQLHTLALLLLITGPVALVLASSAGYAAAAASLRPVESMRRTAEHITEENPSARLPIGDVHDEISQLGTTLNGMLSRLEHAVERERAFVADASHELRTPLSILRTEIELALRGERTEGELRAALASAAEETDRLTELAESLLVIARADEGKLSLTLTTVAARELLSSMQGRFAPMLREHAREIEVSGAEVVLTIDRARLEQALRNLVENALEHGRGTVHLSITATGQTLELHVRDEGLGLPNDFIADAFERFSRGDAGRTGGGAGLGLAIVQAIARAHGGTARVANVPGGGADFWIELPREGESRGVVGSEVRRVVVK